MALSEARKRANAKWDKENTAILSCKVPKETAELFKKICKEQGTTTNAVLLAYVKEFVKMKEARE